MNRNQLIALLVAALNLALILLVPPFDTYSITSARLPVFGGFTFYAWRTDDMVVNLSLLYLEIFVVLINLGIALLLLRNRTLATGSARRKLQNVTLLVVAVNLVVILLFPPFESVFALTKAALPSFEGFYFVFAKRANHIVVSALLYLEVMLVLVNGAIVWLLLQERTPAALTAEEAGKLLREVRRRA